MSATRVIVLAPREREVLALVAEAGPTPGSHADRGSPRRSTAGILGKPSLP
jgi:hypothetical protein